jgi:hypothetical protein
MPVIFDPTAVIPPRATTYRRDPGYWLDEPGTPHRDYRHVDAELGERIIAGLTHLRENSTQEEAR